MKVGDFVMCNYTQFIRSQWPYTIGQLYPSRGHNYDFTVVDVSFLDEGYRDTQIIYYKNYKNARNNVAHFWGTHTNNCKPINIKDPHFIKVMKEANYWFKEDEFKEFLRAKLFTEFGVPLKASEEESEESYVTNLSISKVDYIKLGKGYIQEDLSTYKPKISFIGDPNV